MTVIGCGLLSLLVFVLWIKGGTDGSDVQQTPILWGRFAQNTVMITAALIKLSAALLCIGGLTGGSDVSQTPLLWSTEGQSVTMNCSHTKGGTYRQMYWYQQLPGKGMKQIVFTTAYSTHTYESGFSEERFPATKTNEQTGSLTVKQLVPEDSGVYFCSVLGSSGTYPPYFGEGTKLTVLGSGRDVTEPKVKILRPSARECRNSKDKKRKKTLVCVASGFYPDHVKVYWYLNEKTVTDGVATDEAAREEKDDNNKTVYKITSRLRVYAKQWENPDNIFKCTVKLFNGTDNGNQYIYRSDTIKGDQADTTSMSREKYLTTTQNFKVVYSVLTVKSCAYGAFVGFLVWKLQRFGGKQKY
ncbi:immunoglobulin lambda-1 light chain [Oreochromis niloticus]|uniref:immunoglobulin lambda-1 light chain n=1 Tax=Oreochromis niloticus TaxID=8128 RepID=UPI000DF200EE|nr:immunoglobulin lambda-1 light chain [Oreochromis niloticus]